jgi:hypothetical protein
VYFIQAKRFFENCQHQDRADLLLQCLRKLSAAGIISYISAFGNFLKIGIDVEQTEVGMVAGLSIDAGSFFGGSERSQYFVANTLHLAHIGGHCPRRRPRDLDYDNTPGNQER